MQEVKDYLLEEQLELYKAMLEAQPQSMFLMDKDKNVIGIFNASSEMLAGVSVEDIVGNNLLTYANDPTSPFNQACSMLNSSFDTVLKTNMPLKFQYMILDTYFEATIAKISEGRMLSQVRDITDIILQLKDVEQKKRNELSIALIAGGLTSWSYDVEKNIISSTHQNNVIHEDMPLESLLALIVPEHRECVIQMFKDIIERHQEHVQVTVRTKNHTGEFQWSDVHAVPHEYSPDGRVLLIIGSQKDVTKEHEYDEQLKKLNKQNALILNNSNSGFAYLTSDLRVEWENLSIVFGNREVAHMFREGITLDADHGGGEYMAIVLQAIETREQVISEFKTKDGMFVELLVQPVFNDDEVGEVDGIVVRLDDVTEKVKFVRELAKAKEKAEQSDNLKSAFLANMSHEIRTPLNSIVGFSQLLPDVDDKEERSNYISIINSNSQVLLNLINDILDLSKIEAGYFSCNDVMFDLCRLFTELGMTFQNRVREGVTFIVDVPDKEFLVRLDRVRVSQIVSNFMTNAIKFTRNGFIKMGFTTTSDRVRIYVEDTGCGMTEEQVERVFERFEKFDSFEQGTGLGTSIAKAIVDAYQGKVGVESVLGVGSTFWAILPVESDPGRPDGAFPVRK